jgi:hypothetical protein
MPSPFPGMDPYLEGALWTSVHVQLSVEIARDLAPRLRPRYVVRTPRRFVLSEAYSEEDVVISTASLYPDVSISRAEARPRKVQSAGGIATAPLQIMTAMPEAVPQITVEIRDSAKHELVTAIEVLSPTNKRGQGCREYVARRNRFLLSTVHLMEIDLLREGERVPMQSPLPTVPYMVFLSRGDRRPMTDVWPIGLTDTLPQVNVPLLPGDADVMLDLQAAFTSMYDVFGYDLDIDYSQAPEVPLSSEDWVRAQEIIRSAKSKKP